MNGEHDVVIRMVHQSDPIRVTYSSQERACRALMELKKDHAAGKPSHSLMATTQGVNLHQYVSAHIEKDGRVI